MQPNDRFSLSRHTDLSPDFAPVAWLVEGAQWDVPLPPVPPASADPVVRSAVRRLLRWGGYKPSGRGRPASESLAKALEDGRWPAIHPLVDRCNQISLESGLPISVLDADRLQTPWGLRLGRDEDRYVFNPSGQELSLHGLLLFEDAHSPAGSPVKDAQRTKVSDSTSRFVVILWACREAEVASRAAESSLEEWCALNRASHSRLEVV